MPKIYGVIASPFVRKVRIALAEKGVEYEIEPVMPMGVSDEFKKISPLGKIPVYEDGDLTLPDSSVICAYLERTVPSPPLYPSDTKSYALALWFEEFADTKLVEVVSPIFFQRFVQTKIFRQTCDEAVVERQMRELAPPVLDYLEKSLEGSSEKSLEGSSDVEGIVGGCFTVADLAIISPLINLHHSGESIDSARWPALSRYYDKLTTRPSIKGLLEEELAAFATM